MKIIALLFILPAFAQGALFNLTYSIRCSQKDKAFSYEFQLYEKDIGPNDPLGDSVKGNVEAGETKIGNFVAQDTDGDEIFSKEYDSRINVIHNYKSEKECEIFYVGKCDVESRECNFTKDMVLGDGNKDGSCEIDKPFVIGEP